MKPSRIFAIFFFVIFGLIAAGALLLHGANIPLLQPSGPIAASERALLIDSTILMLIVIVPILMLAAFFAWWYRAGNEKAMYTPNWEHGAMTELVWWAIPIEVILVLGALTWTSTHELNPPSALGLGKPLTIQVVALPWRWLFIYPEQSLATVNYVEFPAGRDIEFDITSDAPMNSFWIPALGSQIYAMTGMVTKLHLMADKAGTYRGTSANYSGAGFANMKFDAKAVSQEEFDQWVQSIRLSPDDTLDLRHYRELAVPSTEPVGPYPYVTSGLYNEIVDQFNSTHDGTSGMQMDDK